MFKLDLITTLAAIVIATSHMAKATPFNPVMKIAGGDSTTVTEFPFTVRLVYDRTYSCTGSIIGDRWILTAAHCIVDTGESKKTGKRVIRNSSKFDINMGQDSNINRNPIVPKSVYVHPKYDGIIARYDVGLLELSQPLKFTDSVQPVKFIKDESKLAVNQMLTAVGWGQDLTQKSVSKLNRVDLSNGGSEYCAKSHPNFLPYRDQLLCNRYVPKKGTCHGDSGGPLLIKVANSNGVVGNKAAAAWLQAGVTSFGYNILNRDSDACGAEGTISFFARIDYFISWIAQTSGMPVGQFTAPLPKQLEAK